MNGQMQIGNKKKNAIDNDGPVSKKLSKQQKKNLNKTLTTTRLMQQIQEKKNSNQQKRTDQEKKTQNIDPKKQRKIDDIKAILQNHKKETIKAILQKHNYDKQQAMQQLFNIPQDQNAQTKMTQSQVSPQGRKKKDKKKQTNQQIIGNQIINEMYDNNQEIDPSEFEQLFAEITDIIKQEQKNKGMALFQINQFIDNCFSVKDIILENQTQIYIDEDNQLYMKTQLFLQQLIKSKVALQNKRKQDFPTLGAVNKEQPQTKSYIQKIQDQYKQQKKKQEYFTPSKVPQVQHSQNIQHQMSVFSISNNPTSYADILQLNKEYNDMGIDNLKFIYFRLEGDINLCKTFLGRFYPGKKRQIKIQKVQNKKITKQTYSNDKKIEQRPKRIVDQNYKNHSLRQIRQQLDHLFKLRSMFRMTKGKTTNIAHRKQLERLACRDDPKIRMLSEIARYKVIQQMAEQHPQYIDLHGYREQQIDDLFDDIQEMVRSQFRKGNSKLETIKSGNNVYCVVKALTGKGLHSKYNKSVLKPSLFDWCKRSDYKANQTQDSVNVYIEVR